MKYLSVGRVSKFYPEHSYLCYQSTLIIVDFFLPELLYDAQLLRYSFIMFFSFDFCLIKQISKSS